MSAFMLPPERLRALAIEITRAEIHGVDRLLTHHVDTYDRGTVATIIAFRLYQENVASLRARYGERSKAMAYGPEMIQPITTFVVLNAAPTAPGALAKLAHCYAYQACEHDGWDACDVKRVIDALCDHLLHFLPGYETAEWG